MSGNHSSLSKWPLYESHIKKNGKPWIAYSGTLGVPGSGASAEHAFAFAQTLVAAGYTSLVLPFADTGRPEDLAPDGRWIYQGIPYLPVGKYGADGSSRFEALKVYAGLRYPLVDALKVMLTAGTPMPRLLVVIEAGWLASLLRLKWVCHQYKIPLVAEEVEWHEPKEPGNNRSWVAFLDAEIRMRFISPSLGKVIVNNSFLAGFFERKNCRAFLLPPVLDTQGEKWKAAVRNSDEFGRSLRLAFCGSPDRDRQDLILEGIQQAVAAGIDVTLEYVGFSLEYFMKLPGICPELVKALGSRLVFHGRVSEMELRGIMARADFSIIFRPKARWSDACFPSKLPEFLSLGVPVICNLTSDLEHSLTDGRDALFVPELTSTALLVTLLRASRLGDRERAELSKNARLRAENTFDVRQYAGRLREFIEAI